MMHPDVHARVEAMKMLGLVRDGDRHWPEFSVRTMRDGRFIDVDTELGDGPRPTKARPARTIVRHRYREYHVCFGHRSDLTAALEKAGYDEPSANHCEILDSVMRTFRHLSWRYYDEESMKQWCKKTGIPYREDLSCFGLCYALTARGVAIVRKETTGDGKRGVGNGSGRHPAHRTANLPPPRPDGCYPPRTVVWSGQEHDCDLTTPQMAFLNVGLTTREIGIEQLMHRKNGLVWKERYRKDRAIRDKISQFLSRLNNRLSCARPPLGISFSLRRGADSISRDEPATSSTDRRLTVH